MAHAAFEDSFVSSNFNYNMRTRAVKSVLLDMMF